MNHCLELVYARFNRTLFGEIMSIKISQIEPNSKYLNDVITLGDANKETLGFFPKDAYKESARKKWIIIAVDDVKRELAGYLLYRISRQKMLVSIVHICVANSWRGQGIRISKELFRELKKITAEGYLGVRVRCRVDYSANKLWPILEFVAIGEMDGRGKKGTKLTIWEYQYNQPSLFSYALRQNEDSKVKVAIDANVFFQLQSPDIPEHEESLPLLEPWLDIDLYITPEMLNEINRNTDKTKREAGRKFASSFNQVDSKSFDDEFQKVLEDLKPFFLGSLSQSDVSDLRQLAYAISADIPFFVTRDGSMLEKSEDVFEKFGIQILRPSDLVLKQDELIRGEDYAPSRLAGSQIRMEKVHGQQSERLITKFLPDQGETKSIFRRKLHLALSNASTVETYVVMDDQGNELGLISHSRQFEGQIVIPIFRVGQAQICQYVAKYLVNKILLTASAENRNITKITDEYLSPKIIAALQESGFVHTQDSWVKITIQEVLGINDAIMHLSNSIWPDFVKDPLLNIILALQSVPNQTVLLEIEKRLWPLKIEETNIPSFIVPIRPIWAMHLFDIDIAGQDLFGGEPSLILNAENVYYRRSTPKVLAAPGRVLWYVSAGDGHYQGSMHLKACSYLDEVEIGKPKQLFSKFKNLGIYKWKHVYNEVAGSDLNKEIMAFKFSKTEILKYPIHLSKLQAIWKAEGKNFNNAVSPLSIGNEPFLKLYNLGMKGQ